MLILRDGRPGRQGEGGLRVALTLCALAHSPNESPLQVDVYAVSYGRGAARGEQHCEAAKAAATVETVTPYPAGRPRVEG